jgi:hypothetical protein
VGVVGRWYDVGDGRREMGDGRWKMVGGGRWWEVLGAAGGRQHATGSRHVRRWRRLREMLDKLPIFCCVFFLPLWKNAAENDCSLGGRRCQDNL